MIPPTPITTMPSTKAKIGFSIDSIVGDENLKSQKDIKHHDFNKYLMTNDCQNEITRALRLNDHNNGCGGGVDTIYRFSQDREITDNLQKCIPMEFSIHNHRESSNSPSAYIQQQQNQHHQQRQHQQHQHQLQQHQQNQQQQQQHQQQDQQQNHQHSEQTNLPTDENLIINRKSRTPSPHRTESLKYSPSPIPHNGPIRPLPLVPQNLVETKNLPPYLNIPALGAPHNPHILQAQFQMAAALAQRQAEQHGFSAAGKFGHHPPPHLVNPNIARDSYPLYPWLISRHGRIFPHGFPGNFLLHPFRKPKRVRTAFSPSQLLKLEHAFESNQYVVGAERKALAQALNLSETQVKVWFQNRRTKHKRMQQEEESKGSNGNSANSTNNDGHSGHSYDEDEMIDMDDCSSDDEGDLQH